MKTISKSHVMKTISTDMNNSGCSIRPVFGQCLARNDSTKSNDAFSLAILALKFPQEIIKISIVFIKSVLISTIYT